jgi:hypothetical protein
MLGGIGHGLVSAVEEAIFFHGIARRSQPDFRVKGDNPLTEHYSVLGPEVREGPAGEPLGAKDAALIEKLLTFHAVVVAGQARATAWPGPSTICSPTKPPAGSSLSAPTCSRTARRRSSFRAWWTYTDDADAAFARYAAAGMHVVRSTDPMTTWPGLTDQR